MTPSQRDCLRRFVRAVIKEGPATPQMAQKAGMALAFAQDGDDHYAVLYDHKQAEQLVQKAGDGAGAEAVTSALENSIKAMTMYSPAATGECWKAWEVRRSAAEKGTGYGPMMYYVTMAVVPSHTIMSDRGSVSQDAGNVWSKFNGASGVKALKLDDEEDPKTEPTEDDCKLLKDPQRAFLDYAYRADNAHLNLHALTDAHDQFTSDVEFSHDGVDVGQCVRQAARNYFQTKYGG